MQREELSIGLKVIFTNHYGTEIGHITSWNKSFVFVDYETGRGGLATLITDLTVYEEEVLKDFYY